eukprot:104673-Prymnesium_polylepis.1
MAALHAWLCLLRGPARAARLRLERQRHCAHVDELVLRPRLVPLAGGAQELRRVARAGLHHAQADWLAFAQRQVVALQRRAAPRPAELD